VLRLRAPVSPVAECLRGHEWITAVEPLSEERLRIVVRSMAEAEVGLPKALAECAARVVSLVPQAADLEDVFLELTS
jgi:hypothetical protein